MNVASVKGYESSGHPENICIEIIKESCKWYSERSQLQRRKAKDVEEQIKYSSQSRTEENRAEQRRAGQNRTKQSRAEQNRTE